MAHLLKDRWLFVLIAVCTAMMAPLFIIRNIPTLAGYSDFFFYSTIQAQFSAQLWHGEWYPRWLADTNAGLGSPVFLFYGPASFYIGSLFYFLHGVDENGKLQLIIGMWLALVCSAFAFYAWASAHLPWKVARPAALFYAVNPFKLTNIYYDFSVAQLWAFVWMPLILHACDRLLARKPSALIQFSLLNALLLCTRISTVLTFGWIPLCYLFYLAPANRWRSVGLGMAGMLLAAGLSGLYLLPLHDNMPNIAVHYFYEGKMDYRHNFNTLRTYMRMVYLIIPTAYYYWLCPASKRFAVYTGDLRCFGSWLPR